MSNNNKILIAAVIGFLLLVWIWLRFVHWLNRRRINRAVERGGDHVVRIKQFHPHGQFPFFSPFARWYDVECTTADGHTSRQRCQTGLFRGVFWSREDGRN